MGATPGMTSPNDIDILRQDQPTQTASFTPLSASAFQGPRNEQAGENTLRVARPTITVLRRPFMAGRDLHRRYTASSRHCGIPTRVGTGNCNTRRSRDPRDRGSVTVLGASRGVGERLTKA